VNKTKNQALPNYRTEPLKRDYIGVAAVQMNPQMDINPANPKPGIRRNLDAVKQLMVRATAMAGAWPTGMKNLDLVVFPEFTLNGWNPNWNRDEWQRVAVEVPGEETEEIAKLARQFGCYIAFAGHTREKEWPGHYFNTSMIIDLNGEMIHKHWKAHPAGPGFEWSTTVHEVLDEFVERYGWDAVWPVARTPIGNLATYICSEGFVPDTARAFAFKGAEILCRCIGGGGYENKSGRYTLQFRADCAASHCYGIFADGGLGDSMLVDYFGRILNHASDCRETVIYDSIPLGSFRATRERPFCRTELYIPVMEQFPGRYPPNLYLKHGIPRDAKDAARLSAENRRY
jgi:predicted amidohydrolase